jgi:hypothetical protein
MPYSSHTEPVTDSITKVNDEVAVGSDLGFQRRWWRFERAIWIVFITIVILDVLGVFGRGWVAKAERKTHDGSMEVKYERIERFRTPSILAVQFGPSTIHDGKVQLWVSESLVKPLGAQRVIPQPASSVIGQGGILYTFPATTNPASVEFGMEPASAGISHLALRVPGWETLNLTIGVMP